MTDRAGTESITPGRGSSTWMKKIRRVTEDLVASLAETGEPRGTIPGKVIRAAREALSDRPSSQLIQDMVESIAGGDGTGPLREPAFAGLMRDELDSSDWRWDTPTGAESVMAVIQQALDEALSGPVPPYWAHSLGLAARIVTIRELRAVTPRGTFDRTAMLGRVMELARESLGDADDDDATSGIEWDGGPVDLDDCRPMPGLYRHVIRSLDLSDPEVFAAALCVIEAAARDELARDFPGQAPCLWA